MGHAHLRHQAVTDGSYCGESGEGVKKIILLLRLPHTENLAKRMRVVFFIHSA
jgi:hypothetical protein